MVYRVDGVHANGVEMIFITEVVYFVVRGIHMFMILIRTHLMTLPTIHHNPTYLHMVNTIALLVEIL